MSTLAATALLVGAARAQVTLPAPVERVIAEAEARADPAQRWAFTRAYTRSGETIVARYDPRRPAGEEWRLTTPPSETKHTKRQREMFEDMQAESGPMADRLFVVPVDDRRVTVNSDFERVEVEGERADKQSP